MSTTTYIETWSSPGPNTVLAQLINAKAISTNSRIVLAFASFNFDSPTYVPGIKNMALTDIQKFTSTVKAKGAKVSLSIGGATYPFTGSDLYSKPGDLANNINQVLCLCGFDGVDFDIEDSYQNVPQDFAHNAASLINTLRSLNHALYITLTTPCQAWSPGMYQQSLLNMTIGNINAWQPMEYDLWVDPESTYQAQIQWDINYYMKTWNVAPNKIILGLMPGADDMGHILSLQEALDLTSFAKVQKLQGVMTWDANADAIGIDGNAPFAYLMGIQTQLAKSKSNCCQIT